MARTIAQIKQQILDAKALQPVLTQANSTSATAIFNLMAYIVAVGINLLEQLKDIWTTEAETIVKSAPVGSDYWLQQKVFEFQYDATNPQIVTVDPLTLSVGYPVVDETKRIITRCSVKTTAARIATVKVAKQEPPVALSTLEKSALISYLTQGGDGTYAGRGTGIGFAGAQIQVVSSPADYFYLVGTVFYNGQYAAVIQQNVIDAINNYWSTIPFNGNITITDLVIKIKSINGVSDVIIQHAAIRANGVSFGSKTYLINNYTEIYPSYPTFAGYVIGEPSPNDLATTLTFVAS